MSMRMLAKGIVLCTMSGMLFAMQDRLEDAVGLMHNSAQTGNVRKFERRYREAEELFNDSGSDPWKMFSQTTSRMCDVRFDSLCEAFEAERSRPDDALGIIRFLLGNNTPMRTDSLLPGIPDTALARAARCGAAESTKLLIDEHAADPNELASIGLPVHCAAAGGHEYAVSALLARGARPDYRDFHGRTAMVEPFLAGETDMVRTLLYYVESRWQARRWQFLVGRAGDSSVLRRCTAGMVRSIWKFMSEEEITQANHREPVNVYAALCHYHGAFR